MIIRKFEIGSDDDELTIDRIMALPTITDIPRDTTTFEPEDDENDYYKAAFDNNFHIQMDYDNEVAYICMDESDDNVWNSK